MVSRALALGLTSQGYFSLQVNLSVTLSQSRAQRLWPLPLPRLARQPSGPPAQGHWQPSAARRTQYLAKAAHNS